MINTTELATKGTSQTEAWNQSVANIETYMTFLFVAIVLIFLTQIVIVIQLKQNDAIKMFDDEGWFT